MAQQQRRRSSTERRPSGTPANRSGRAQRHTPRHVAAHAAPTRHPSSARRASSQSSYRTRRDSSAYAAQVRRAPKRRRSALPAIIAVAVVLVAGLAAFLVLRSCGNGAGTSGGAAANDQATLEQAELNGQDGTAGSGSQKNADGSVDINLLMVGDILYHYQVRMSGLQDDGSRNYDHIFQHVLGELENKDIKVLNQETPLGGSVITGSAPDGFDGYPEFNGPQEIGDAEAKAGFNVVLKATNHAMDHSSSLSDPYTLVRSEQNYWATQHPEMAVIGEANPDDETSSVDDVYVFQKDGFKVALLNYTQDLNGNEGFDTLGVVSMLEEDHVRETMAKARELADMIVVFPHWGEEYNLEPVEMQYEWAQFFVDQGADVIIGNHPHVMEPVTTLTNADGESVPCYWSTGNFVSTSPSNESLVGGIAEITLHKDADGKCSVTSAEFKPIISHIGLGTSMTTYLITDWTDDLASTNYLNTEMNPDTDNTSLTPEWANSFCTQVLGSNYDAKNGVLKLI